MSTAFFLSAAWPLTWPTKRSWLSPLGLGPDASALSVLSHLYEGVFVATTVSFSVKYLITTFWRTMGRGEVSSHLYSIKWKQNCILDTILVFSCSGNTSPTRHMCVCLWGERRRRRQSWISCFLFSCHFTFWPLSANLPLLQGLAQKGADPDLTLPASQAAPWKVQTPHTYRIFRPNSPLLEGRKFTFLPCCDQTLGLILCPHILNF